MPFFNKYSWLWIALLLTPLLFFSVRADHDWGDDFAQYLHQTQNICEGKPMAETGFLIQLSSPTIGPKAYPPGFPVLLSPVYAIWGDNFLILNRYMAFWLIVAGVVLFLLLKKFIKPLAASFFVLWLAYNPFSLILKNEVIADIPFLAFVAATLLLLIKTIENRKYLGWLIVASLFAWLIKSQGIVLFATSGLILLVSGKHKSVLARLKLPFFYAVGVSIPLFLVQQVWLKIPVFDSAFTGLWSPDVLLNNTVAYFEAFRSLTMSMFPVERIESFIIGFGFLLFLIAGIVFCSKQVRPLAFYTILYLVMLLNYDYRLMSMRYMYHLIPFLMLFILIGVETVWNIILSLLKSEQSKNKLRHAATAAFFALAATLAIHYYLKVYEPPVAFADGPCTQKSQAMFEYIKTHTRETDIIIFEKPRAMAYFAGRKTFFNINNQTKSEFNGNKIIFVSQTQSNFSISSN